jgi:hypothetical protein
MGMWVFIHGLEGKFSQDAIPGKIVQREISSKSAPKGKSLRKTAKF